jgi:Mg/Co/Ni transporter MgtE
MADKKFNDEWEALPEEYRAKFLELLEERGLSKDFDNLPDESKSQILDVIKEHVFKTIDEGMATPDPDIGPTS